MDNIVTTVTIGYHGYCILVITLALLSAYNIISLVMVMIVYMK